MTEINRKLRSVEDVGDAVMRRLSVGGNIQKNVLMEEVLLKTLGRHEKVVKQAGRWHIQNRVHKNG